MLKLKIAEKEYEANNCFETTIWTGESVEKYVSVALQDSAKADMEGLVGEVINASVDNDTTPVVTLTEYRVSELTKNYNYSMGINVRLQKVTV